MKRINMKCATCQFFFACDKDDKARLEEHNCKNFKKSPIVRLKVKCTKCLETETIEVTQMQITLWRQLYKIQQVMPELSASQREMLISQTCSKCWDEMFGGEENE